MRPLLEPGACLALLIASIVSSAVTRPRPGLAPFPSEVPERICGTAPPPRGTFPAEELPGLIATLHALDTPALERRICASETREEVAYGVSVLGARQAEGGQGDAMLQLAADRLANPLAMASVGHRAWLAGDLPEASRYLEASAALAEEVGVGEPVRQIGRSARRGLSDPRSRRLFDPEGIRSSTQRFVERRLLLYRALYGIGDSGV